MDNERFLTKLKNWQKEQIENEFEQFISNVLNRKNHKTLVETVTENLPKDGAELRKQREINKKKREIFYSLPVDYSNIDDEDLSELARLEIEKTRVTDIMKKTRINDILFGVKGSSVLEENILNMKSEKVVDIVQKDIEKKIERHLDKDEIKQVVEHVEEIQDKAIEKAKNKDEKMRLKSRTETLKETAEEEKKRIEEDKKKAEEERAKIEEEKKKAEEEKEKIKAEVDALKNSANVLYDTYITGKPSARFVYIPLNPKSDEEKIQTFTTPEQFYEVIGREHPVLKLAQEIPIDKKKFTKTKKDTMDEVLSKKNAKDKIEKDNEAIRLTNAKFKLVMDNMLDMLDGTKKKTLIKAEIPYVGKTSEHIGYVVNLSNLRATADYKNKRQDVKIMKVIRDVVVKKPVKTGKK